MVKRHKPVSPPSATTRREVGPSTTQRTAVSINSEPSRISNESLFTLLPLLVS